MKAAARSSPSGTDPTYRPARSDALRQINRGETRPAPHIENQVAATETGTLPGGGSLREPELMLQTQPFQLGTVSAEHIIFFVSFHRRSVTGRNRASPTVAPTSKSAVSRVSKPADRKTSASLPI